MKAPTNLRTLALICLLTSSIPLKCTSQSEDPSVAHLKKQMESFQGRVRVYYNCLRKKCDNDKRAIVRNAAIKDGIFALLLLGALTLPITGPYLERKHTQRQIRNFRPKLERVTSAPELFDLLNITEKIKNKGLDPKDFEIKFSHNPKEFSVTAHHTMFNVDKDDPRIGILGLSSPVWKGIGTGVRSGVDFATVEITATVPIGW